ncbi:MAG: hypothetical protein SV253_05595 [Halobacteria archaeon]|nr:hypothetical protein [Halobacteria archaeon]
MRVSPRLPGFVALETIPVLAGVKKGASIQIDSTYFEGNIEAVRDLGSYQNRERGLHQSYKMLTGLRVEPESFDDESLMSTSDEMRDALSQIPEIPFLEDEHPGDSFTVPEWVRHAKSLNYGARTYFFGSDSDVDPSEILRRNVEAVVSDEERGFERYQGTLHGYPDCCVEGFGERTRDDPPEWRSVEPLSDSLNEDLVGEASLEEILPGVFDSDDYIYAFFSREFFPEPDCENAIEKGRQVYDALTDVVSEDLVRDYFRLNYVYSHEVARSVVDGETGGRPDPGSLSHEHLDFYYPFGELLKKY